MERAQANQTNPIQYDPDPVITWVKTGGGSLRLPNKLIPPGGTFKARASEIPQAFRDIVVPAAGQPTPTKPSLPEPVATSYKVVPRGKSKTWFDVVDGNGKRINEKALTKAIAQQLANDLM